MAIWSLVLSIAWLGGLGSMAGICSGSQPAGIAVGVITLLFAVAYWAILAMHTGGSGGGGGGGY